MDAWKLPTSLEIGGIVWDIRTDFKAILDILKYFNDPNYTDDEKWEICLDILFVDFEKMNPSDYQEAMKKATEFIDMGIEDDCSFKPRIMDWEQDAPIIIPSINKVLGKEIRAVDLHWWTFLSAYMEIGEGLFSEVISIRSKKAKGKKLEKYEKEFYRENRNIVDLAKKYTDEEIEEQERLKALLG